jgi:hypothetical protein
MDCNVCVGNMIQPVREGRPSREALAMATELLSTASVAMAWVSLYANAVH